MLDKRYKHRSKDVKEFYLFVKYPSSGIYYVKFRDGNGFKVISTGETDRRKASQKAYLIIDGSLSNDKMNFQFVLKNYYKLGDNGEFNDFITYDLQHNVKYGSPTTIKVYQHNMEIISELLSDVKNWDMLTRKRISELQHQLLELGKAGQTINIYMYALKKILNQMVDRGYLQVNPMSGIKPVALEREERKCFPLELFKGKLEINDDSNVYDLLIIIAMTTGMRRSEILTVDFEKDVYESSYGYMLHIRGGKSKYCDRNVPIPEITFKALKRLNIAEIQIRNFMDSVYYVASKIGLNKEFVENENIKFHSFRKMYKTCITQANLNESLTEYMMGHTTKNQASTSVRRVYFVEEAADFENLYKIVIEAIKYFIKEK